MNLCGCNHGYHETRLIHRVRVQRGRRPSVIGVCGCRIRCRRRGVGLSGRSGLGIAPVAAKRPPLTIYQLNTRPAGGADIVICRGPQRDAYRNRMAAENKAPGACVATRAFANLFLSHFSVARKKWGRPRTPIRAVDAFHPPLAEGGGQKSAFNRFRLRHGAEGINKKWKV